jgi:hypothetical protein
MTKISRPVGALILILAGFIGIAFLAYSWHLTDLQETALGCQQTQVENMMRTPR